MNVGYVRISKDDNKKNYVSIENQKLILQQYAANEGFVIERWYEDDGVSGYIFDRPAFKQMMNDLDKDIDCVYVKDFSRLGRHNAKVLLLLEEFKEREKNLIVIDDNYNSKTSNDDTIGIKTWFNERYIKDTSKKIKSAIQAKQHEGTLITKAPFGYKRNSNNKNLLEIIPYEAEYIKNIYNLYISGAGYRKIANQLTQQQIPTPSMLQQQREIKSGYISKRKIAYKWTDSMIKEILNNDFYIGTLRLKKRTRNTIHGKDKRVPKNEQYVFENHHPAIIDKKTFFLVQELKEKRKKNNYRGSKKQFLSTNTINIFANCLFCKDCHSRLTLIKRKTSNAKRKYYICSAYNSKGRNYCSKSHLINEEHLIEDILNYIKMCRNIFSDTIANYDLTSYDSDKTIIEKKRHQLSTDINNKKYQLKVIFTQKLKDLSSNFANETLINETYDCIQKDLFEQIYKLEMQLKELDKTTDNIEFSNKKSLSALNIIDTIINNGTFTQKDIELLINQIVVDENGMSEINLKYGLSSLINYNPADIMNFKGNTTIAIIMKLIAEEKRDYTSVKYLYEHLTALGFNKTKHEITPYIELMKILKIIEYTDNPLKPYNILKSKKEISQLAFSYLPDLPTKSLSESQTEITAKQIADKYLHNAMANRWYATDAF